MKNWLTYETVEFKSEGSELTIHSTGVITLDPNAITVVAEYALHPSISTISVSAGHYGYFTVRKSRSEVIADIQSALD